MTRAPCTPFAPRPTSIKRPSRIPTEDTRGLRGSIVWMLPFTSTRSPRVRCCALASLAWTTPAVNAPPPLATAAPASALLFRKSLRDTPDFLFMLPSSKVGTTNKFFAQIYSLRSRRGLYIELGRRLTTAAHESADLGVGVLQDDLGGDLDVTLAERNALFEPPPERGIDDLLVLVFARRHQQLAREVAVALGVVEQSLAQAHH